MQELNPIQEFFKYAKEVKVHAYSRHIHGHDGPTTIVDEHMRHEDGAAEELGIPKQESRFDGLPNDVVAEQSDDIVVDMPEQVAAPLEIDQEFIGPAETAADDIPLVHTDSEISEVKLRKHVRLTKEQEIELWKKWKEGGQKPSDLEPLLHSFGPLINLKMSPYKGRLRNVPDSAIVAEHQLRFAEALRTYNPDKGSLGTYVYRYLDKAKRFIGEHQNVGRIPENRLYRIKAFNTARGDLIEELGRLPSEPELAKKLGWPIAEVGRMGSELRNDLVTQGFEEDPYTMMPSKSEEVLRLFKYELQGKEREVYEYLTGYGKPRMTSTGAIARTLKMPDYQVSRIKDTIQHKLRRYVEE